MLTLLSGPRWQRLVDAPGPRSWVSSNQSVPSPLNLISSSEILIRKFLVSHLWLYTKNQFLWAYYKRELSTTRHLLTQLAILYHTCMTYVLSKLSSFINIILFLKSNFSKPSTTTTKRTRWTAELVRSKDPPLSLVCSSMWVLVCEY